MAPWWHPDGTLAMPCPRIQRNRSCPAVSQTWDVVVVPSFQGTRHTKSTKSKAGLNLQLSLIAFHLLPLEVYAWRNDAMRDTIWCNMMQHDNSYSLQSWMQTNVVQLVLDDLWRSMTIYDLHAQYLSKLYSWICLWSVRSWHQTYFRRIAAAAMTSGWWHHANRWDNCASGRSRTTLWWTVT